MAAEQEFLSKELDLSEPSFFLVGEICTHTYTRWSEKISAVLYIHTWKNLSCFIISN